MSIAAYQGVCSTCRHDHSAPIPALASGSGDHAELARLAEAATPGPWKGRQPAYSEGTSYIESELPCINGLSAWFSVAIVPAPSPEELGYSDGAIDSDANAAFIAAANPATVLALLAEIAALRANEKDALKECSEWARKAGEAIGKLETSEAAGIVEGWKERATEAERKLAEAVGVLRDLSSWFDGAAHNGAWIIRSGDLGADDAICAARTFLSKEAERG